MERIKKYERYGVYINKHSNILHIEKPIPVEDFIMLKRDLKIWGIKVKNIIVGDAVL